MVVPGDPDVLVRIQRPSRADGPLPCIVSLHGGGYTSGDASLDDSLLADWCEDLGVVGIAVNYRLAPQTPYPGPLMDCYTVLTWIHANASEIGVDPDRIGLHGTGAGAGLAAALALVARDHRDVPIAFQVLDAPMLDDRPSHAIDAEDVCGAGWRAYLGELDGSNEIPGYAAAARYEKLRRLPPAFLCVRSGSARTEEAATYTRRLQDAGVSAELHMYDDAPDPSRTEWLRARLAG